MCEFLSSLPAVALQKPHKTHHTQLQLMDLMTDISHMLGTPGTTKNKNVQLGGPTLSKMDPP